MESIMESLRRTREQQTSDYNDIMLAFGVVRDRLKSMDQRQQSLTDTVIQGFTDLNRRVEALEAKAGG